MTFAYETLKIEQKGHVVHLSVNRPDKLNALNEKVLTELKDFLSLKIKELSGISGILLFGEGEKAFIAGADIKAMQSMSPEQASEFARLGQDVSLLFESIDLPIIAAVDGFALGGGCEMAMACDMIYATEKSVFGQPEVNLGLIPGFGGTQRLIKYVGRARAKELIYTGRNIKASEGLDWGLVTRLFSSREEMFENAIKTLDLIATKSPLIVGKCKQAINVSEGVSMATGLELEREGFMSVFHTEDTKEGINAFLEKRRPEFKNR